MDWSSCTYLLVFFRHSKGPSLEPQPQYYTICCTVVAIWNQFWNLHASEPSSDFRRNHIADSIMFFDLFSPRSCRRRTMGYFGKQSPKHYFGFQHAGQNSMESGYDYVWQFRMPYIVCEKYLMWLFYSSNNLGWFACFRIQFLPDHIMIHSCLVCVKRLCRRKTSMVEHYMFIKARDQRVPGGRWSMKTPPRDPCKGTCWALVVHLGAFKPQLMATIDIYI